MCGKTLLILIPKVNWNLIGVKVNSALKLNSRTLLHSENSIFNIKSTFLLNNVSEQLVSVLKISSIVCTSVCSHVQWQDSKQ